MQVKLRIFGFVFLLVLLMFSVSLQHNSLADSHEDEPDEEEDEFELEDGSHDRQIEVNYEVDKINLEAELKNNSRKDSFKVELKTETNHPDDSESGEIEVRFKYQPEFNNTEKTFQFRMEMNTIVEYAENASLAFGYQQGEEVSAYNIGGTGWEALGMAVVPSMQGNKSVDVYVFNATTTDGVFTLIVRVAGSVLDMGNGTLTPNSVKMDVIINDFPYTQPDTKLALRSKVKTTAEMEVSDDSLEETMGIVGNETEIKLAFNETQAFFSWAEHAYADGNLIDVIDSELSVSTDDDDLEIGEDSRKMYFSFNTTAPSQIVWDPKLGVVSNDIQMKLDQVANATTTITETVTEPGETVTETVTEVVINNSTFTDFETIISEVSDSDALPFATPLLIMLGLIVLPIVNRSIRKNK